ncbi:hypothetical protein WG66_016853 [Moniliophthora roreri]|nr:hypothetical protein WG66_016853 [Moniliophthora roreri]
MADPSLPAPHLDLGDTFGAFSVAVNISSCLYGVTCLQTWYYFRNYHDRWLLRGVVLAILVLETAHAILAIHAVYHYLVLNFANPAGLSKHVWSIVFVIPITTATNTIVHLFYAARIYLLSGGKDWWTPAIVCVLKIVQIVLSISAYPYFAAAANSLKRLKSLQFLQSGYNNRNNIHYFLLLVHDVQTVTVANVALSCNAALDIICALALSYYLHTSRSGVKSTETLINRLIAHAINNGALTSLADISVVIFLAPIPKNLVYLGIFEIVGNLYANSLLSTLNSRNSHLQASLAAELASPHLSFGTPVPLASTRATGTSSTDTAKPPVQIFVETESGLHRGLRDMESLEMKVNPGRV